MQQQIRKILVANRGEIAVRVMRACRDLGIISVGIYSDCDSTAFHVRIADQAFHVGGSPSSESYLVQDNVIRAAKESGADAIHPGYGFLSENASFAQRCADEGIIFIGPTPETIRLLGDKILARETALKADLPVVPGINAGADEEQRALAFAKEIGFPVLVKAAAGGGGKGMRVVESEDSFTEALQSASREAASAFGDGRVFIEKYLTQPRHVEIQILCDTHGNYLHLGERECSIQRRHQKVIEESPSPIMTPELREKMGAAAVNIARASNYVGAGTVEFLVDVDQSFYFLEVNTRLQVEHPVTELVTGVDLVHEQIAIAEGKPISFTQDDVQMRGHAIECRIYAEDPEEGFLPSTGRLTNYRRPSGPGVRTDSGVVNNSDIPIYYDPMIAKLSVWGASRQEAIWRMHRALAEYRVSGVRTTIGFHQVVLENPRFIRGDLSTNFLAEEYPNNEYHRLTPQLIETAVVSAAVDKFTNERKIVLDQSLTPACSGWVSYARRKGVQNLKGAE